MQVLSFPGCCTAKVLAGFGQEANAAYGVRPTERYTEETMRQEIHRLLTGYQIGRHNGLVFATLTTRQTMGIKVLTEMGFKDTGAKDKTGHRETDLHGFYICPAEYIDSDYAKEFSKHKLETAPKRYVKDLNRGAALEYRYLMDQARRTESSGLMQTGAMLRERAKSLLLHDRNFS